MRFDWIAAVLAPRDILLHVNFSDPSTVSAPAYFAAIVNSRMVDLRQLDSEAVDPVASYSRQERDLIEATAEALGLTTAEQGSVRLRHVARALIEDDLAMAVSAGLVACLSLSEQEEIEECRTLLSELEAATFAGEATMAKQVLFVLVRLQTLMRFPRAEVATDNLGQSEAAHLAAALDQVELEQLPTFTTSEGVAWGSLKTYSRIFSELRFVLALAQWPDSFDLDDAKREVLRGEAPQLLLEASRSGLSGLEEYVHEQYDSKTLSTTVTWRNEDVVDTPIWRALVHFEVTGNKAYAQSWRRALGEVRLLRQSSTSNSALTADALQLLRHSQDTKSYSRALEHVRANGPLIALGRDVRSVVNKKLKPARVQLTESDLKSLQSGAQVLEAEEASSALAVLTDRSPSNIQFLRNSQHPSVRAGQVIEAAAELALVGGREETFVDWILKQFLSTIPDDIEGRAIVRALERFDWSLISTDAKRAYAQWIAENADSPNPLLGSISVAIGTSVPPLATVPTVDRIVRDLNRVIEEKTEMINPEYLAEYERYLSEAMEEIVASAHAGAYSRGGISIPDLAAGLILYAGATNLWDPLTDLLVDVSVDRNDKTGAIRRLARDAPSIPVGIQLRLQTNMSFLLDQPTNDPFDQSSDVQPFPEALALAAATRMYSSEALLIQYLRLVSSPNVRSRIAGARSLTAMVTGRKTADQWSIVLALQLASDEDANVRAHAGRVLSIVYGVAPGEFRSIISSKLDELLDKDGVISPLLVLRGLMEEDVALSADLRASVKRIADDHLSFGVRAQAKAVLNAASAERPAAERGHAERGHAEQGRGA